MILHGDCLEEMRAMEDSSVDSVVTDPPYGISFMGKKWDYDVPKVEVWKEAMRVLKAGGHILIACGTRTQHRMAVNIEDAGFEIRDIVAWVYGSGFPKSHNIGKAVDKLQGNERDYIGKYQSPENTSGGKGRKFCHGGQKLDGLPDVTKGTSEYEGWGTALKPAMELWTLARKPLSEKTIAENVLKWGTGGINIDECRVDTKDNLNGGTYAKHPTMKQEDATSWSKPTLNEDFVQPKGRFPANLIHDGSDEVVGLFPETGKSNVRKISAKENVNINNQVYGKGYIRQEGGYDDSGSASRFFYCAKASKSERNAGLEGFEEKVGGGMAGTADQTLLTGSGNIRNNKMKNHHPTVKPIKLMQYLTRLITPKGGTVLDPYMGSGTTGIACKKEGFEFIGIELDADYFEIAKARIVKQNQSWL
mgnify:FL=1